MTNILFIAYEFPPLKRIGTQRPAKFIKYLRDFDINPIVITLSESSYSPVYGTYQKDYTLLKELPVDLKIYYIEDKYKVYKELSRLGLYFQLFFFLSGVEHRRWFADYKRKISKIIETERPSAIVVTVPPFGIIKTSVWTSKTFGIPLIIDLRDPWTLWRTYPYHSIFHYIITKYSERCYLKKASAVITTSEQTQSDLITLHPQLDHSKFKYVSNGFDLEFDKFSVQASLKNKNEIFIGYVGSFYYNPRTRRDMLNPWWKKRPYQMFQYKPRIEDWLYRSPFFFFRSISEFLKLNPVYKQKIKIKFAGNKPSWLDEMISEFHLEQNFEHLGELSLEESFEFQRKCDLLLLTSSKVLNGRDYSIAGKTFEYFSFQKPVLGFVTEGAQKDILIKSGISVICDPDDIEDSILKMKLLFEDQIPLKPNEEFMKSLNRKNLTHQLSEIITRVIHSYK